MLLWPAPRRAGLGLCKAARMPCAGVQATGVAPGSVALEGGRTVSARRGVVVATDARSAEALLGDALEASPSKREPGVGTCNLYFRCVPLWKGRVKSGPLNKRAGISGGGRPRAPSYNDTLAGGGACRLWELIDCLNPAC